MSEKNVKKTGHEQNPSQEEPEIGAISPEIGFVYDLTQKVRKELHKVIVGQERLIDLLLAGLLSNGHILIEGVPGIAKTLIVKLLARTLDVDFKRIQFTPDLMPSDVIGTNVFNMKSSEFLFKKGPVFSNFILIDEINRAPAKTQAALFEVMEEKQITVDGETYPMNYPLFIVATQNPIEQEGTYKLPEAQLDRFLFRIKMTYPVLDEEKEILNRFRLKAEPDVEKSVKKVLGARQLQRCTDIVNNVTIKDELLDYIANIIYDTRNNGDLFLGASPRASLAVMNTSKALAAMKGRDFVTPDDIQFVAYPVLNHRIILSPEREMEGLEAEDIIRRIIKKIEVPR
ncbi:MAG: MoxR family ATPase [Bacteroidales bacterium]|jgi:MoxR-like ATPase